MEQRHRVTDVELMTALAHPLRGELLRHLMAHGPRTASECAEVVGSTASNCSWHLRQLAKFGLVEPVDGGDGRQRPWRATIVGLELGELADDDTMRTAQLAVLGSALRQDQQLTQRFLDRNEEIPPEWRDAGALDSYALKVTPEELTGLAEKVDALLRPYVTTIREDAPPEARTVHAAFRAFLWLTR
ncbi:MAG: helix-turn-helix domain-containing protein [Actinophytocola sp.]|uniref:ArsR/SmtB family transcription factor n=1 Tax=Actinophytocola sp. TaxID=1872138 RepID=UPI003C766194